MHLKSTTSWHELGVLDNVSSNSKSIGEVSLDLVEHILGSSSEDDGASLWVFALSKETEIIVSNLVNLEEATFSSDVGLLDLLWSVDNGGTSDSGDSVVIGLSDSTHDRDVLLHQEVLGNVRDSLLGDDDVGLDTHNVLAHTEDLSLFHGKGLLKVVFLGELHVGHGLSLLVLKRAIEENNSGVLNVSSHLGVSDVLVEHNTVKDLAVLKHTTWDLFNLGVSLNVDLNVVLSILAIDSSHSLNSEIDNKVSPLAGELGSNCGVDNLAKVFVALEVDWFLLKSKVSKYGGKANSNTYTKVVGGLNDLVKSAEIGVDNDGGVDLLVEESLNSGEDLSSKDDDGGSSITDLFVLSSGELDHGLGSGVLHIDFSEDGVSIVGQDDSSHRVEEHLEHALGTKSGSHDVGDGLGSLDVGFLGLLALLTLCVFVEDVDGCLHFKD